MWGRVQEPRHASQLSNIFYAFANYPSSRLGGFDKPIEAVTAAVDHLHIATPTAATATATATAAASTTTGGAGVNSGAAASTAAATLTTALER
jgi:hypothetical protein